MGKSMISWGYTNCDAEGTRRDTRQREKCHATHYTQRTSNGGYGSSPDNTHGQAQHGPWRTMLHGTRMHTTEALHGMRSDTRSEIAQ
jgi:hypothetical protein